MQERIEPKCKNCIYGDALVINDGVMKKIKDIKPNTKTFVDGKWYTISNWQHTGKLETLKITTTLGLELNLTEDHLVYVVDKGWIPSGDLQIGDKLSTLKHYPCNSKDLINKNDALLIGAITGDGWKCKYNKTLTGIGFGFSAIKLEAWKPMLEHAATIFNSKEKLHLVERVKKPFLRIDWRNKKAEKFSELIDKAKIPEVVWKSSEKVWGAYLSGLFSTDGCLACNYKKNTTQIRILFFQSTETLIREVQMMLRMMGIHSYLKSKERPPHKDLWTLTIGRINSISLFTEKIGFVDEERNLNLQQAIIAAKKPPKGRWSVRRKVNEIERVKRIEKGEKMDVYDISVPEIESFYANGILVHNCLLYNREKGICKVAVLINGEQYHLPVFPEDHCHMDELGIPVQQVRWFVADPETGEPTGGDGVVKIEYPEDFFGNERRN